MTQVMIFDKQPAGVVPANADSAEMQKMATGWRQICRTSVEVRTSEDKRNWENASPQNLSFAIDIRQKSIKRPNPLLEPAYNLIPLVTCKNLRQQIAEPGIAMIVGREFKCNSQFPESCIQSFLKLSQIRRSRAFQLAHKSRIRRSRVAAGLAEHFVPPSFSAVSVSLCHAGLDSVSRNRVAAQGLR